LHAIGNHVMPRTAGCGKDEAEEGRGESLGAGQQRGRAEGEGKTRGVAKGVKTAVNMSMAVANLVKLDGIRSEGD